MSSERVKSFIRSIGVPCSQRNPRYSYAYDGKTIALDTTNSDALHDAAHWIVCANKRRLKMIDFGLGPSPDSGLEYGVKKILTDNNALIEELRASILGISFEAYLNLTWRETAVDHNWLQFENDRDVRRGRSLVAVSNWIRANVKCVSIKHLDKVVSWIERARLS